MSKFLCSRLGRLLTVATGTFLLLLSTQAQSPNGWQRDSLATPVAETPAGPLTGDSSPTTVGGAPAVSPPPPQEGPPMALMFGGSSTAPDEITPEIAALTQGVIGEAGGLADYVKCFLFVTNQLEYEHYYGCKKGALLTYLERKGNDADLATLLVAMLRSAGYTARYGSGVVALPTAGDPNGNHVQAWLGVPVAEMATYTINRGFPEFYNIDGNYKALDRVWVEVDLNGTWQKLDPAVKKRVRITPSVDVASASGYTRIALETAAGGTLSSNAVEGISYAGLSTYLADLATDLLEYIDLNKHDADPVSILGGWRQEPFLNAAEEQLLFPGIVQAAPAEQQFTALPASLLTSITLEVRSTAAGTPLVADHTMPMANLQGRRLSLTFTTTDATGKAQLWLDDDLLDEETTAAVGTVVTLKISIDHPHDNQISATLHDQFTDPAKSYQRGARYALVYSFNPTQELLHARQEQLDAYRRQPALYPDTSREVVTETLNVIGLTWMHQTELTERVIGGGLNCDMTYHHRIGRAGQLQESDPNQGYYLDVDMQFSGVFPMDGDPAVATQAYNAAVYYSSALEHAAIEQTQGADKPAVSTVKLLKLANDQPSGPRKIFYATPATWGSISPLLQGYSLDDFDQIQAAITAGGEVLVPENGHLVLNQWTGAGFITRVSDGVFTTTRMAITNKLNGGQVSVWPSSVSPLYLAALANANPVYTNTTAPSHGLTLSWDPIDLASGNYYLPATDLEVGAASPRGFAFSRQYHGGRRAVNPTGLGYGWTHNWHVRATRRTAYESALGLGGSAYDVASAMVAVHATRDLASIAPDALHWTLACFTAHWLADQLQDNAVSISIGERSLQFVRRADESWQAPPGVTMSLTEITHGVTGAHLGWQLTERHGNTYNFDDQGRLTSIVDLWAKQLDVTYTGDKVATVTDAYNRQLTFNYTGSRLTGLTDSTGRTVGFANASENLETVTDPEDKLDRYFYDGEHRITEVRNHDQEIIAKNFYDSAGRLNEQHLHGDNTKIWRYSYTANSATEENPLGGRTTTFFDQKKRQTGVLDALGRLSSTTYDGQDRVKETKTPLGYTEFRTYDRYHNVRTVKDKDNFTTTYDYDGLLRLEVITDPLTHTTTFTYNNKHQPETITNHLNEVVTHVYNPTTGTLTTTEDPAHYVTGYGYNGRDELRTITHLGVTLKTIERTIYGDPETVTDGRNNDTGYTYNLRRQPETITEPGNFITTHTYDNQRRVETTTDPRNFTTSFTYSPTGKLLTTTRPGDATTTQQYDSRNWLESTTNPLNETTRFFYRANGELAEQRDPLNRSTYFEHDDDSRQIEVRDALGHKVVTDFNGRGLPVINTDPLIHSSFNIFDAAGRRTDFINRRTKQFEFTHDDANRPLNTETPNGRLFGQTRNSRGLVETQTEPSTQSATLLYDSRGRLQSRADAVGAITYGYDDNNNLETVTQAGVIITRTYNARNLVETYNDGRGHTLTYGYDENRNLTTLTYEPGKTVTYTYDNRNRLTGVLDWTGRSTTFGYDDANRLTTTARPNDTVRTNHYDDAGQLETITDRNTASGLPVVALRIAYDNAGRLTGKIEKPSWTGVAAMPTRALTYNDDNQVATVNINGGGVQNVTHDLDGNITNGPSPLNGAAVTWTWNTRNQLTGIPGVTFAYDAEGLRTTANATTQYVNDPHGAFSNLLYRIRPNGTKTYYIYGPHLLYEIEENAFNGHPADFARYYHYDHLGSTIALSEGSGVVLTRLTYSAYGTLTKSSGEINNLPPFLWNGAFGVRSDPGGLQFMRARYYHPLLGRFLSEDPLGLAAGPNVYAYADGNPVTSNDPNGLSPAWADMRALPNYTGPTTLTSANAESIPISPNLINYGGGLGDGLSFNITQGVRYAIGVDNVDTTSGWYRGGSWTSFAVGTSRLAYAGLAKAGSLLAQSGAAASQFRQAIKAPFRLGMAKDWRPPNLAKYTTDDALRAAAGRTNPGMNAYGGAVSATAVQNLFGEPLNISSGSVSKSWINSSK